MHWLWSARSKDESCLGTTVDGSEILCQWIGSLSHDLQGFIHPWWCRISSINSRKPWWKILTYLSYQLLRISPFNSQILLCPGGGKILLARCWWRKGGKPMWMIPKVERAMPMPLHRIQLWRLHHSVAISSKSLARHIYGNYADMQAWIYLICLYV